MTTEGGESFSQTQPDQLTPPPETPEKGTSTYSPLPTKEQSSLLDIRQRIKNFFSAGKEIGHGQAFLSADTYKMLELSPSEETALRKSARDLMEKELSFEELKTIADNFRKREETILKRTKAAIPEEAAAIPQLAGISLGGTTLFSALGMGFKETLKTFSWPIGAFLGVSGAKEILKGKGNLLTTTLLGLKSEVKELFEITKCLQSASDAKKIPDAMDLLMHKEELAKNPNKLKRRARGLAELKKRTMKLALVDNKLGFSATIPKEVDGERKWIKVRFSLSDIFNTLSFFEKKLFAATKGDPKLQKQLILISLGLPAETKSTKAVEKRVVDLEKDLLMEATSTKLKLATGYALAIPAFTVPFLQLVPTMIEKTLVGAPVSPPPPPQESKVYLPLIFGKPSPLTAMPGEYNVIKATRKIFWRNVMRKVRKMLGLPGE